MLILFIRLSANQICGSPPSWCWTARKLLTLMESLLLIGKEKFRKVVICPVARPADGHGYAIAFTTIMTNKKTACKIDLLPIEELDMKEFENLHTKPIYGCLGLLKIVDGTVHGRKLYRIEKAEFISLNSPQFDSVGTAVALSGLNDGTTFDEYNSYLKIPRQSRNEHPCANIASLLSEGTFYFAYDWDCTKSLQKSVRFKKVFSWQTCERSFFWNRFLLKPVTQYLKSLSSSRQIYLQTCGVFVVCFEGFADVNEFVFGSENCAFAVFSRISCKRAGTRYRSRGIDDDGNVSNFVETETIFAHPDYTFSHITIRGTVPVFWDQQGFQLGFPRIQLTRTPAATQPAFDRHINNLHESYGMVHTVDLLSQKEGQAEQVLSSAFEFHARKYPLVGILSQNAFDVYAICRNNSFERLDTLFHLIGRDLQIFGYLAMDATGSILKEQKGIFRVNCLDCLDRTNIVQNYIVKRTVDLFVRNYLLRSGTTYDASVFQNALTALWSVNGDQLSRIYTGSNAIKSSYGRLGKFTLSSFVEDFKNTAKRFYSNNFAEKLRQQSIDIFLGKNTGQKAVILYSPAPDLVDEAMKQYKTEYSDKESIIVQILTWNTNGFLPTTDDDFSLLVSPSKGGPSYSWSYHIGTSSPHIIAVGFQEIVGLNATQIMSVDPERRILWENHIAKYLNDLYPKNQFSLLVSHQLVGVTISVFTRSDLMDAVRQVEIASKKTGMGGMTGNKGSVAVRMDVYSTGLCFVVSHFAAGQTNPQERDRDMVFALKELQMSGGRDILAHDIVFWFGDFNYRVKLDRDIALELIRENNYDQLKANDQLKNRMHEGLVFEGFKEADINFAPTYKYDVGTNVYDTSEKMRTPSWTDRILFLGEGINPLYYDRAEVDASDHKPVKGIFEVLVLKVDRQRELRLRQQISEELNVLQTDTDLSECETMSNKVESTFDLIQLTESLSDQLPPLPPRPRTSTK